MRLINKAGLLAGALTTLLILASCSDSDTSTGVTAGRDAAKEISDMELFQEDDLDAELIDLDTGPDEDMSALATAAEDAYDSGVEIEEIIEFIRQHLGLKFGDY